MHVNSCAFAFLFVLLGSVEAWVLWARVFVNVRVCLLDYRSGDSYFLLECQALVLGGGGVLLSVCISGFCRLFHGKILHNSSSYLTGKCYIKTHFVQSFIRGCVFHVTVEYILHFRRSTRVLPRQLLCAFSQSEM